MNTELNSRIGFITSSMPQSVADWNSIFIGDMYQAFQNTLGTMHYWGPPSERVPQRETVIMGDDNTWLNSLIKQGGIANVLRNAGPIGRGWNIFQLLRRIRRAVKANSSDIDIYFVNWLQNCLSLPNDDKPILVTALGTDVGLLKNPLICLALRRIFKTHPTTILYNAKWMGEVLEDRLGQVANLQYRPLGIRASWFERMERSASYWISVSRITESKVSTLFKWAGIHFNNDDTLVLIGPNQEQVTIPSWVKAVGSCSLDDLRDKWYPNAKGLIFLSEHNEGRPQTIIEAMASGVPVICLDKPLYREFIISGENGYLVNSQDDLAAAVTALEDPTHNQEISINAVSTIKKQIGTWDDYADDIKARIASL